MARKTKLALVALATSLLVVTGTAAPTVSASAAGQTVKRVGDGWCC